MSQQTMPIPAPVGLPIAELVEIVKSVGVLSIMGKRQTNRLVVDHIPKRGAFTVPRERGDGPLNPSPVDVHVLEFRLEDAMFGTETYVALTCGGQVVVKPFYWTTYDALANLTLT